MISSSVTRTSWMRGSLLSAVFMPCLQNRGAMGPGDSTNHISHPEQNGAHERMHRTLKAETTRPPAGNRVGQQRKFDAFRYTYNHERPHEALDQQPPARRW